MLQNPERTAISYTASKARQTKIKSSFGCEYIFKSPENSKQPGQTPELPLAQLRKHDAPLGGIRRNKTGRGIHKGFSIQNPHRVPCKTGVGGMRFSPSARSKKRKVASLGCLGLASPTAPVRSKAQTREFRRRKGDPVPLFKKPY